MFCYLKTSTRTRCAFEVAALDEGAHVIFSNSQMGKKNQLKILPKYLEECMMELNLEDLNSAVEALAKYSGIPVWNGLTDVASSNSDFSRLFND
ncbi:MAG: hypothetical protein ACLRQF_07065 [Thomasclavelia ramosa]